MHKTASLSLFATTATIFALVAGVLSSHGRSYAQAAKAVPTAHAGEEIFTQRCFACHSVIQDQVRFGPSLYHEMKPPHPKKTAAEIRTILKEGKGKMPPFKDILTTEDTENLLAYLHSL